MPITSTYLLAYVLSSQPPESILLGLGLGLFLLLLPLGDHAYPLVLDLLHQFHYHRVVELALGRVEELLVRARAVVALLVLERLHHHVQPV